MGVLMVLHVDDSTLHELASQLQGRAKDMVHLTLAHRADGSVRKDIVQLAQDPKAGLFRQWAVTALERVGTSDELLVLQTIADTDPLIRKGGGCFPRPEGSGPTYPVRESAKQTIHSIKKQVQYSQAEYKNSYWTLSTMIRAVRTVSLWLWLPLIPLGLLSAWSVTRLIFWARRQLKKRVA